MQGVIEAVKNKMPLKSAAPWFSASRTTLSLSLKLNNGNIKKLGSFKPVFLNQQEQNLMEYIKNPQ